MKKALLNPCYLGSLQPPIACIAEIRSNEQLPGSMVLRGLLGICEVLGKKLQQGSII